MPTLSRRDKAVIRAGSGNFASRIRGEFAKTAKSANSQLLNFARTRKINFANFARLQTPTVTAPEHLDLAALPDVVRAVDVLVLIVGIDGGAILAVGVARHCECDVSSELAGGRWDC